MAAARVVAIGRSAARGCCRRVWRRRCGGAARHARCGRRSEVLVLGGDLGAGFGTSSRSYVGELPDRPAGL